MRSVRHVLGTPRLGAVEQLTGGGQGRLAARGTADHLAQLLDATPPSYLAWTIPIEPLFLNLRGEPGFEQVLGRLAERAK